MVKPGENEGRSPAQTLIASSLPPSTVEEGVEDGACDSPLGSARLSVQMRGSAVKASGLLRDRRMTSRNSTASLTSGAGEEADAAEDGCPGLVVVKVLTDHDSFG